MYESPLGFNLKTTEFEFDIFVKNNELKKNYDIQTHYLINLDDIYEYIKSNSKFTKYVQNMDVYISKYKGI